ncbi:hypothetical protein NIES2104_15430 [Leptolyngbya sp. NIES-2104]|nr:hypothetical protein NIES2104_15430 [Leptolyngbya sp. NIES-2104]
MPFYLSSNIAPIIVVAIHQLRMSQKSYSTVSNLTQNLSTVCLMLSICLL